MRYANNPYAYQVQFPTDLLSPQHFPLFFLILSTAFHPFHFLQISAFFIPGTISYLVPKPSQLYPTFFNHLSTIFFQLLSIFNSGWETSAICSTIFQPFFSSFCLYLVVVGKHQPFFQPHLKQMNNGRKHVENLDRAVATITL